jgi:hypothetical protein
LAIAHRTTCNLPPDANAVAEAQTFLSNVAEELRDDGDADGGKCSESTFAIANAMDERAIYTGKKFATPTTSGRRSLWP